MKLTIGTARLQAVLNKAVKGAGCNKLIPMTSLIAIKLSDGVLTLTTTDATNYLSLTEKEVAGDDLYVAVQIDLLAKLVSRMTCKEVTLEVENNYLNVIGNGQYQIDIPLEDDGTPVKLPNPIATFDKGNQVGTVNSAEIATTLTSVKPALATKADYPWYTCYYVGNAIMATDTYMIANYEKGFLAEPKLVSPIVMDLLGLLTDSVINVYLNDDKMLFETDCGAVYGIVPAGIENYSITELNGLVEQEFDYSCVISKSALLNLLDRISLFVGEYDNGKIALTFNKDYLEVTSRYASEMIEYTDKENAGDFVCSTDVATLIAQIKAQTSSEVTIEYGKDNAIKILDGDITSVVALLEE